MCRGQISSVSSLSAENGGLRSVQTLVAEVARLWITQKVNSPISCEIGYALFLRRSIAIAQIRFESRSDFRRRPVDGAVSFEARLLVAFTLDFSLP